MVTELSVEMLVMDTQALQHLLPYSRLQSRHRPGKGEQLDLFGERVFIIDEKIIREKKKKNHHISSPVAQNKSRSSLRVLEMYVQ